VLTIDTTTNVFIALRWCSEMIMCFAYEHTYMYKDSDMHKDSDCIASGMQDKWAGLSEMHAVGASTLHCTK